MNDRGQVMIYGLMVSLVVVVLALALATPVKEVVDGARNGTDSLGNPGMNCSSTTISNFDKAACVTSDLSIFQFVGGLIMVAGAIVSARIVFN